MQFANFAMFRNFLVENLLNKLWDFFGSNFVLSARTGSHFYTEKEVQITLVKNDPKCSQFQDLDLLNRLNETVTELIEANKAATVGFEPLSNQMSFREPPTAPVQLLQQ